MKETKFIEQNQEKWASFEEMLKKDQQDPEKINDLFVQITDDLSYARTFYPNRSVRMYLNGMAQRIVNRIYKGKQFPAKRLKLFWSDELPAIMWQSRKALLLAFSIFALAFLIGMVSSVLNPEFAKVVLGESYVRMTLENIQKNDPMAVYKESQPLGMSVGIAANNLFVAFRTAIFGVLASIGTVFIMLYNGVMIGAFQYFFIEKGLFWQSFLTIWIHGTLEISAIIIAGAAGLVAGSGLLFPGTYSRAQAFQVSMRRGLKIFIGIVPVLIIAAFIEGFLTRYTETPDSIRGAFILICLVSVLWYFVWLPWYKYKNGRFLKSDYDKEMPAERAQTIDFSNIKTIGSILSDAFTIIKRNSGTLIGGSFWMALVFVALAFFMSKESVSDTYYFRDDWFSVLYSFGRFFINEAIPLLFYIQVFCMILMAFITLLTVSNERQDPTENRKVTVFKGIATLLFTMPFLVYMCTASPSWVVGLLILSPLPYLAHSVATAWFETENILSAVWKGVIRCFQNFFQVFTLNIIIVAWLSLSLIFLGSPIWDMAMQLFGWMVPPGEGMLRNYYAISTTVFAMFFINLHLVLLLTCGSLFYFSNKERSEANELNKHIQSIGGTKRIRGLVREGER